MDDVCTGGAKRSVTRSRLHTTIVEYLLQDIQNGTYKEGEELPSERDLMETFGVGRPAIRESLSALERMGLVDIRPGMRTRVRRPTVKPLLGELGETLQIYMLSDQGKHELLDFRLFFESMIVRELCKTITEEQLQWLANALEKQKAHLNGMADFTKHDLQFHQYLGACLNNPLVGTFCQSVSAWVLDSHLRKENNAPQQAEIAFKGHQEIYSALCKHDADAAEMAMQEHLRTVQNMLDLHMPSFQHVPC
ncbi:MAG TPA: FCD domain-containing protein [Candidatus Avidesulfovibrio excrementigallinarum]|nr:FCD domain-containing protein [Candidatus Avidesulfovibrio excrementigallinarum]